MTTGCRLDAVVLVQLDPAADADTAQAFERDVAQVPQVTEVLRLLGSAEYLLRVVTDDLEAYRRLQSTVLAALPGVRRVTVRPSLAVSSSPLP